MLKAIIQLRVELKHLGKRDSWKFMMSGTEGVGKKLVQTQLAFISGSSTSKDKLSFTSNPSVIQGQKRKFGSDQEKGKMEDSQSKKKQKGSSSTPGADDKERGADQHSSSAENSGSDSEEHPKQKGTTLSCPETTECTEESKAVNNGEEHTSYNSDSDHSGSDSEKSSASDQQYLKHVDNKGRKTWLGKSFKDLVRSTNSNAELPKMEWSSVDCIFVRVPFHYSDKYLPTPYPSEARSYWDDKHVRLPHSKENVYPVGEGKTQSRWEMIKKALGQKITDSFALEEAILSYNKRYINRWNFTALHEFFNTKCTDEQRTTFFDATLGQMVSLALRLPELLKKPIPLLKKHTRKSLTFSQEQIACLLANAFLCTFPRRNSQASHAEYSAYPDINFNNLFGYADPRKMEKLRCIIHYFSRVLGDMPKGLVTFTRQVLQRSIDWDDPYNSTLTELCVSSEGTIEDDGEGMLQVDFANKYIGGGVLGHGCVQEEIRFLICPEMIVARLFTEGLDDKECLIMKGCERYSNYDGYANTFRWSGNHCDKMERDSWGRRCTEVVAIDAMVFKGATKKQFSWNCIHRELDKAYCGFTTSSKAVSSPAVCTGNWGCGAFGGDKHLKALIQILAASVAHRDVCYLTFGDDELRDKLLKVHRIFKAKEKTVGDILRLVYTYERDIVNSHHGKFRKSLFDYIISKYNYCDESCTSQESPNHDYDTFKRSPDYRKINTP